MNTPKFSIFRADGSRVPTLKKAFLVKEVFDFSDYCQTHRVLEDGTRWQIIYEEEAALQLVHNRSAFCIASYQAHTHGNFAVVRLVKERSTASLTTEDLASWAA